MRAATAGAEPLLGIVRRTLKDLRQQEVELRHVTLDSTLDHDLGLDSLARVELFARIERELGLRLPDSIFETAETLRDIATALGAPQSGVRAARGRVAEPPAGIRAAAPPADIGTIDRVLAWHVQHQPDFAQITLCGEGPDETLTYLQLWGEARAVAGGLQRQGIRLGDTVALAPDRSRLLLLVLRCAARRRDTGAGCIPPPG